MANRLNNLRVWAVLIFLLAGFPALSAASSQWFTRVWQIDDGLLDNDINGIVQGPDQYLWLVTPAGLMRFDGVNFNPSPIENFTGRISSHIRMMSCSRTGVLWAAFDGGKIISLNPDYSIVSLQNNSLPARAPIALANDEEGALWLGYPDAIHRVQNGKIIRVSAKNGVSPGTFHSLISDGIGTIWLAKGNQISCFQNGKFHQIAGMEGVQCMAATHTNAIWLAANAHLFSCDINGKLRDCGAFQEPSNIRTVALLEDHSGAVWIGTDANGLFHYNQSRFERMETSHSSILSLAEDHEGNMWVGTGGGGLDRITPCGIRLEVLENTQIRSQVQSICQDFNGVLWGATQNGALVSRIDSRWKPVFTNASFAGTVTCVAADRTAIWVGTRTGRLLRIANTNNITWETNIARGSIRGLLVTSNEDVWIVGSDALQRLHKSKMENVRLPRQDQGVFAMAEDVAGNIWFGANGVLLRFNGTNLVNEMPSLGVSGRPICCLHGTDDGSLWIGSRGGGLMRLKNGHVSQIGLGQGLVNNYISQIVADGHGWLWFGSKHGIFRLRQSEVEQAMEDHGISLRPIIYGKNAGLVSQDAVFSIASPFVLPRAILGSDGCVWMLMHTGIVVADPNILSENAKPPPILLTQVAMDGKIIVSHNGEASTETVANPKTLDCPLKIPPSHRHLEFDFTAFNFRDPENLRFRYQLAGCDNGWIAAGTERRASYSRLIAGNYQFRVEASVDDGPWSDPPATLDLHVVPFFWQTWWFRCGILLVFTSSVIAIVRYVSYRRLRLKLRAAEQQTAIERERGRIARDIHDDLGNRLTEIQLLTGLAQRNHEIPKKAITHIDEISSAALQATDALDEIVWAINPRNDTLTHLIDYLGQFTINYMRTAGIRCRVDLPENPPAKSVSAEVRHNLFLAIKESLNNIVRHASATEVSLIILVTDQSLSVIIEDDGQGFSGEVKNDGADGLENMHRRIAEIHGQFKIKSKPGVGTCISFNGLWLAEK
jgi:signal transduction histidine kinase/ligand-binding sensor domain-containing protein